MYVLEGCAPNSFENYLSCCRLGLFQKSPGHWLEVGWWCPHKQQLVWWRWLLSIQSGQETQKQLERYLSCSSNRGMDVLHTFPQIKKLSLKVNTSLPASAACERLFSHAGLLFTAKRSHLHCKNLDSQLLLKLNSHFTAWFFGTRHKFSAKHTHTCKLWTQRPLYAQAALFVFLYSLNNFLLLLKHLFGWLLFYFYLSHIILKQQLSSLSTVFGYSTHLCWLSYLNVDV